VGEGYLTQYKVKRRVVTSTAWPSKTRHYDPSKHRAPLAQQHSVTSGTTLLEPHTSQHKDPSRYTAGWARGSLSSRPSNQHCSPVSPTTGCDRKAASSTVMSHVRSEEVMQALMGATHPRKLLRVYWGVQTKWRKDVRMQNMTAYNFTHSKTQQHIRLTVQHHALAALPPVPLEYEAGWNPKQAWPVSSTQLTLAPAGIQATFTPSSSP